MKFKKMLDDYLKANIDVLPQGTKYLKQYDDYLKFNRVTKASTPDEAIRYDQSIALLELINLLNNKAQISKVINDYPYVAEAHIDLTKDKKLDDTTFFFLEEDLKRDTYKFVETGLDINDAIRKVNKLK